MKKYYMIILFFLMTLISTSSHANEIIIQDETIIDKPTYYKNVTLNLNHGHFSIVKNGSLEIENSKINGTISPDNQILFNIQSGKLILKNNTLTIQSQNIPANPTHISIYFAIKLIDGQVEISDNRAEVDKIHTVGFFITSTLPNNNSTFYRNKIKRFHGGFYLDNSHSFSIIENEFNQVSLSNIYNFKCSNNSISRNHLIFPGNASIGDGMDIFSSNNTIINGNIIATGFCYSISISNSHYITIDHNYIMGGITYAIMIEPDSFFDYLFEKYQQGKSTHISITNNYFSQNRFGVAANHVENLTVKNNIFIQHFKDAFARKFWTNNDILLSDVQRLTWENNFYKEAFSQEIDNDHKSLHKFVTFPVSGGVSLNGF